MLLKNNANNLNAIKLQFNNKSKNAINHNNIAVKSSTGNSKNNASATSHKALQFRKLSAGAGGGSASIFLPKTTQSKFNLNMDLVSQNASLIASAANSNNNSALINNFMISKSNANSNFNYIQTINDTESTISNSKIPYSNTH